MCPRPTATKAAAAAQKEDGDEAVFLRAFAVLLSVYPPMAKWVSPPVSWCAIAWQSVPVLAALALPRAWRRVPMRAVLGLFLFSNVLLVYMHLPSVGDAVREETHSLTRSLTHTLTHSLTHSLRTGG